VGLGMRVVFHVPRMPAFGANVRAHLAADERVSSMAAAVPLPGPAEICRRALARKCAVEKDVTELLLRQRSCGRHIAAVLAGDRAVIEHRCAPAENEIDAAFDVAVAVVLPPGVRTERILPAEEAAVAENSAIAN